MANYPNVPQPQKPKQRTGLLIGCAAGAIIVLCLVGFLIVGGFAGLLALFVGEPEGLSVDVAVPTSPIDVGETFIITVALANEGDYNITINEIRLPNELLEIALVTGINPIATQGLDNGTKTAYEFDLLIAPAGRETVTFRFDAIKAGEFSGDIEVPVGTKSNQTRFDVAISSGAAVDDSTPPQDSLMGELIPYRSVVQIIAIVELDGERIAGWTGSGTIISDDGLILTNAHVVLSDRYYDVVDLIVSITNEQDRPPEPKFLADVIQANASLDLAVIKVRSDLDGGPANFSSLGVEPVKLGRSEALSLGDPIIIIGYPGIGGETITLTRGEVSGFTFEEPFGNRAFIKTSATIAGGNSGGLAATPQGEIIGVPTQVGSGDIEGVVVDCRPLVDTNRDGVIDERDNCVPTGGFINALRPIQLALPLIDAAKAGEVAILEETQSEAHQEYDPVGDLILYDDFSNNNNEWGLGERTNGWVDISGGQLVIDINAENYIVWSSLPDIYSSMIMVVDVEVLIHGGDGDFGFICGLQDEDNFSVLEISEDGYYSIWKYQNNEFISLVDWTYSDLVAGGGPFTMAAYCGPDGLALAVDDILLADIVDPDYIPGRVGLAVGSFNEPNIRVGFDDFVILQP